MLTQETVDRIRRFRGNSFPVLSVYLNLQPEFTEHLTVHARLTDVLRPALAALASLDHRAAESLERDIETVYELRKRIESDTGHAVAIFACAGRDLLEYISMPRRAWDVAVVGAKPYVRPLDAVLDEFHRYCAVVVDRRRAQVYEFYMGELESWHETIEEGERISNFGGWYGLEEYGVRNRAEETAHRHYRETVKLIKELFDERRFKLLLLGGHKGSVGEFAPFLPAWLERRVAGTFIVDPHTATTAIVRAHCEGLEEAYERALERRAVEELVTQTFGLNDNTRRGAIGLHATLDAINARAVDVLLVDASATVPGVVCEACGWLGVEEAACAMCGAATSASRDIVGESARRVIEDGGGVEHVFAETSLRGSVVGALLRYPLAPSGGDTFRTR